jgi:hypothetical protein
MTSRPGPLDTCPQVPDTAPNPRAGGSFISTAPGNGRHTTAAARVACGESDYMRTNAFSTPRVPAPPTLQIDPGWADG